MLIPLVRWARRRRLSRMCMVAVTTVRFINHANQTRTYEKRSKVVMEKVYEQN